MDDTERLVVLLEARIRDFEKNMQKASGTAGREFGRMRKDAQTASAAMEADMARSTSRINQALATVSTRVGAMAAAFGPAVAGAALAGFAAQARATAREIATIGDEAKRAGIGVKAFQELRFVAEQSRVSFDALTDGLKELNLRADEFIVTGTGSGAEAFKRLGFTATDLAKKLKDPSALFTEIIGKMERLDRAAQIRIADEIFGGTGGEQFVQLIEQGEAGIKRTINEARRLGIVMDEDMIAKAAEVDRQFGAIATTIETKVKGAIVNVAATLASFIDRFREFENQQDSSLDTELAEIGKRRLENERRIFELREQQGSGMRGGLRMSDDSAIRLIEEENAALADQERQILDIVEKRKQLTRSSEETSAGLRDVGTSGTAAANALDYVGRNGGTAAAGIDATGQAADRAARDLETFTDKADRLAEVQFPAEYARREAERLTADLERFGASLDDFQRLAIENEIANLGKGVAGQFDRAQQSIAGFEQAAGVSFEAIGFSFESEVGDTLRGVFDAATGDSENFADSVVDVFASLGRRLASAGFDKVLGKIFGTGPGSPFGPSSGTPRISINLGASGAAFAGASGGYSAPSAYGTAPVMPVQREILPALERMTSSLSAAAKAIRTIESGSAGGNYSAMGPVTASGDRALGAYQVMSRNLPEWSRAALGRVVSNVEFLSSPKLQDAIFSHRFGGYMDKYGAEGASRAWFAGEGGMKNYGARDIVGTSVSGYGSRFGQLYAQHSGGAADLAHAVEVGSIAATKRVVQGGIVGFGAGPQMSATAAAAMDAGFDGFSHNGGGFMQSPLFQGGMTALGAGMAGYQSGDPLGGAFSGAMAGLAMGNPIMAGIGAIAGLAGGSVGRTSKSKTKQQWRMAA